jgi:transposase
VLVTFPSCSYVATAELRPKRFTLGSHKAGSFRLFPQHGAHVETVLAVGFIKSEGGRGADTFADLIGRRDVEDEHKIHMAVRGLGCPVRFILTAGQKGDAPQAAALIEGLPAEVVMADTAYDADHLRHAIAVAKGALAVLRGAPLSHGRRRSSPRSCALPRSRAASIANPLRTFARAHAAILTNAARD